MDSKNGSIVYSIDTTETINRIDFCIFSNKDIERGSAISDPNGITVAEINNNGRPVQGGTNDTRLGVTDLHEICGTCRETSKKCIGHFGHIKLSEPVFHNGFVNDVKRVLECVCIRCSKLLVYKTEAEIAHLSKTKSGKQRFADIFAACKKISHCQKENYGCGTPVHNIQVDKKNGSISILAEAVRKNTDDGQAGVFQKRTRQNLSPMDCYQIMRSISNEDCIIMGYEPEKSRPEDMILINFPVPPVQIRPTVKIEIGSATTADNDLTNALVSIVKANENLKNSRGDSSLLKQANSDDNFMLLQMHTAILFDNKTSGVPRSQLKNKRDIKSVSERIKGKEGRVRGNIMGKRVNFSARSVIDSDPFTKLNSLGVPLLIAKNQTFPEIVNERNIEYLTMLVKNGRNIYPGANRIIKTVIDEDGNEMNKSYDVRFYKLKLEYGDIVERHLITGDIVLFNRQPTLHKLSMMAHVVNVINKPNLYVFRMNANVTSPYNADYDGDEMNIHVPQSIQTATELRLITSVDKCFIKGSTSRVAINAVQDSVMGSFVMTADDVIINWKDAMNILMCTIGNIKTNIQKGKQYTGKYVYSQIIPLINTTTRKENGEIYTQIKNGIVTHGAFGSPEISSIVQKIWFQYGGKATSNFLDDLQKMVLLYLIRRGYTIGISDLIVEESINEAVRAINETKRMESLCAITQYENDPSIMTPDAFEASITSILRATNEIQKLVIDALDKKCGIYNCVISGSKGNKTNTGNITGTVGQITVEDSRIQFKFGNRTLPSFYQFDESSASRGFCNNSFLAGLSPIEYFFAIMAGREGLITTAITTADTGYEQRKLIKILEDIKVEYDGTVRNANDKVIQFIYGGSGINTERQIEQKIDLVSANNKTIEDNYVYSNDEINELIKKKITEKYTPELNKTLYDKLIGMRNKLRAIQEKTNVKSVILREKFMVPVDINEYILNAVNNDKRDNSKVVDPYYVLSWIKKMYSSNMSKLMRYNDSKYPNGISDDCDARFLLKIYLYDCLSPKKCTHKYKLSTNEFDVIVKKFFDLFHLAKVQPGEMVGLVGAQSIGEPVTQSNLKSFHKAGSGQTVVGGLVRVKELLSISQKIKTPSTKIIIKEKYQNDEAVVKQISSHLKYTTLNDIIETLEIFYDPDEGIMKKDGVSNIFTGSNNKSGCNTTTNGLVWTIRLVLSKEKLLTRNISMLEIKSSVCKNWMSRYDVRVGNKKKKSASEKINKIAIVSNFDNSPVPTLHIRFSASNYKLNVLSAFADMVISEYHIKGIIGINESNNIVEEQYNHFAEDGTVEKKKRFVIMTDGINLSELSNFKDVDIEKSSCNNIVTIYNTYGIEAARNAFVKEFIMALESSGGATNIQHIELLADTITHMGGLISVNRHGASKLDTDPLSRASFERTVDQLLHAAIFGETDHIRSLSSRIMVGSLINGGTGCFDLLLDNKKIIDYAAKNTPKAEITKTKKKTNVFDLIKKK